MMTLHNKNRTFTFQFRTNFYFSTSITNSIQILRHILNGPYEIFVVPILHYYHKELVVILSLNRINHPQNVFISHLVGPIEKMHRTLL